MPDNLPKPMVHIGYRPMLWHVMKYYAHFGHKDFILCLGYRADVIKNYFLNYNECVSNDFVLSAGGKNLELLNSDIQDWRITFVDTGINSNIGQRLQAVEKYLEARRSFWRTTATASRTCRCPSRSNTFARQDKVASFLCVRPNLSYHLVSLQTGDGVVADIPPIDNGDVRVNGGYFVFKNEIFEYMRDKEELVDGAVPAPDPEQPVDGLSIRRLLGQHGHVQGQAAAGKPVLDRGRSVGGLEARSQLASQEQAAWRRASRAALVKC